MAKERKQDLSGPEEEALEQHVHDMLDITAPDPTTSPDPTATTKIPVAQNTTKKVTVSFADEPKESVADPTPSTEPDPELVEAIAAANEQLSQQATTAPLLNSPTPTKSKKVTVEHIQEETPQKVEEPAPDVPDDAATETPELSDKPPKDTKAKVTEAEPDAPSPKNPEPESPLEPELSSAETTKAVNDIIANEGDALLDAVDQKVAAASAKPATAKKHRRNIFSRWLHSSNARWATFLILFMALVAAGSYPTSRYYALNQAGVTSKASLTVTDQSTLRPLKNVNVSLAGKTAVSDEDGLVQFSGLPLGPTEVVIEKRAFAPIRQKITIGWGSNPLDPVSLKPQGVQYNFVITDVFSGQPLTDVEASVGELTATANEIGEIKLTLDDVETDKVTVVFKAGGYKDISVERDLKDTKPQTIAMVPAKQVAFISKRTGKFDLYKVDADGKNESLVLTGTGSESADITLLQHPTESVVMLINTRQGTYTADGKLQNNLTFVNLKDATTKPVTSSSQVRAIDWVGTRLVYVSLNDTAAADDAARYRLMSYDYVSGDNRQLAAANYFNSVVMAGGKVYYAPSSAAQNGINVGVFEVFADGSGKRVLLDQESWNLLRTDYDSITIAVQQDWYKYTFGQDKPQKLAGQPGDTTSRVYTTSPGGKHSAWIDSRDGKGVIVVYDTAKKAETTLIAATGITGPIRWLNGSTLVYRVATGNETADFVISIAGGTFRKIVDVTNTAGVNRWAY